MINTAHYHLLAGAPAVWDAETQAILDRHPWVVGELRLLQRSQHDRGRRSAQLLQTPRGWIVAAGSSFDEGRVLADVYGQLDGSFERAVAWGIAWATVDPANRECYIGLRDIAMRRLLDTAPRPIAMHSALPPSPTQ